MRILRNICIAVTIFIVMFFDINSSFRAKAMDWTQVSIPFGTLSNLMFSTEKYNGNVYVGTYTTSGGKLYKSTNGSTWTQIGQDGFGEVANVVILPGLTFDWGFLGLDGFKGNHYAGTANENGMQIWRSSDDTNWTKVVNNGFGDANNFLPMGSAQFNDYLYVATWNFDTGVEVWRSEDGATWTQANIDGFGDINNFYTSSVLVYGSYLYVFTGNWEEGAEIWRTSNGTTWEEITTGPATDQWNWSFDCRTDYNGELYVGTTNILGGQLWKTSNGANWTQITGPGFLRQNNIGINPLTVQHGYFYVGTYNITNLLGSVGLLGIDVSKYKNKLNEYGVSATIEAGEVWTTNDGSGWVQQNTGGFGGSANVSINSSFTLGDYIYVWTFSVNQDLTQIGSEIWRARMLGLDTTTSTTSTATSSTSSSSSATSTLPRTGRSSK